MGYSLAKIAEELGVSKATVSMVLNGKARQGRISEDVERTVREFCRKVNYVPNIHARRINQKHSNTFGFLVSQSVQPGSNNPFSDMNITAIMGGIVLAAEELGFRVSIQLYNSDMSENRTFEWLRNREIDGLIYYGLSIPDNWKKIFGEEKHCIVGIGTEPNSYISSVNIDNFQMSAEVTKHLLDKGRKRFMYISGAEGTFVSDERKRGCISTLREYGIEIPEEYVLSANYSETLAEEMILKLKPDVDAIVCANDDMAIGAIRALKNLGIRVPEDVAVAGGDNVVTGKYISPALTTFENMQHQMGVEAVSVLNDMITNAKVYNRIIDSALVIRESTI